MAKHPSVTEMSESGGALASGPESSFVVAALGSILDGDAGTGRRHLDAGAEATSWTAVLHRLDVAGRALALDAELVPTDVPDHVVDVRALARAAGEVDPPPGLGVVLRAWSRGDGVPVSVDLDRGEVDTTPERLQGWAAGLVLAWLVDRSGFPPQVVA